MYEISRAEAITILSETLKDLERIESEWGDCRGIEWVAENCASAWWKAIATHFGITIDELFDEL